MKTKGIKDEKRMENLLLSAEQMGLSSLGWGWRAKLQRHGYNESCAHTHPLLSFQASWAPPQRLAHTAAPYLHFRAVCKTDIPDAAVGLVILSVP